MMSKNGFLACTEYVNGTIYMSSAMDQALWLKTLIHEVTHVAQQEVGRESSEEEANWAAVFVHDLFVNNPEVALAYLELAGWTEPFDEESAGEDDAKGS